MKGALVQAYRISHLTPKIIGDQEQDHAIANLVLAHPVDKSRWRYCLAVHRNLACPTLGGLRGMTQLCKGNDSRKASLDRPLDLEGVMRYRHLSARQRLGSLVDGDALSQENAIGCHRHFFQIEPQHRVMGFGL